VNTNASATSPRYKKLLEDKLLIAASSPINKKTGDPVERTHLQKEMSTNRYLLKNRRQMLLTNSVPVKTGTKRADISSRRKGPLRCRVRY
jgi:hypothetical protein